LRESGRGERTVGHDSKGDSQQHNVQKCKTISTLGNEGTNHWRTTARSVVQMIYCPVRFVHINSPALTVDDVVQEKRKAIALLRFLLRFQFAASNWIEYIFFILFFLVVRLQWCFWEARSEKRENPECGIENREFRRNICKARGDWDWECVWLTHERRRGEQLLKQKYEIRIRIRI